VKSETLNGQGEVLDAEGVVDGSRCVAAATTGPFVYAIIFDAEGFAEVDTMRGEI